MLNIFYLFGVILILLNFKLLINSFNLLNVKEWLFKYKKITKENPSEKDFRKTKDYNLYVMYSIFITFETIWLIFGLLTNYLYFLLPILLFNFLLKNIKELLSVNRFYKFIFLIFLSTKLIIYLYIILDALKLNIL